METPKKRRWWIWIIVIAVICICLISVVFIFMFRLGGGQASPPPQLTTALTVTITSTRITNQNGSNSFGVPSDSDLTLQSTDANIHNCIISGSNLSQPISVQLSNSAPSEIFELPVGSFRLICDNNPNRFATITAK
jgi:hypothetical protein